MTQNDLIEHKATIYAAQKDYDNAKEDFMIEHCPFCVGDTMEIPEDEYYTTHSGKSVRVDRITLRENTWHLLGKETEFVWNIAGSVIKKDGMVGLQTTSFEVPVVEGA